MRIKMVINNVHWVVTVLLLYTTKNNDGGATVPIVFRYYLRTAAGADIQQLRGDILFLSGTGSISSVKVDGGNVDIEYSGQVYGIERKTGRYFLRYIIK